MLRGTICSVSIAVAALAGVAHRAEAQAPDGTPNLFALGAAIGTLGVGGEMSYLLHENFVFRANASYLSADVSMSESQYTCTTAVPPVCDQSKTNQKYGLSGTFAGLILDWHPVKSGWRLSAGVRYMDLQFKAVDSNGGSLGTKNYSVNEVGAIRTTITNANPAAPYFGFGYDAAHFTRGSTSFNLGLDVGALYGGQPDVKITTEKSGASASDINAEVQQVKDSFKKYYQFYPVLMLSGRLSF